MAKSPYNAVGGDPLPFRIPELAEFGFGEGGAAGARIESHPFYRHRLNKRYMKRSGSRGLNYKIGGKSSAPIRYLKPGYDPDSGLSEEQWQAITKGGGLASDAMVGLAGVQGGKWYSQSQFDEGGQLKEGAEGFGGRSVYGTLAQGQENWRGVYEGGGYGYPSWAEGWYEPARYVGLEQQLSRMGAVGSDAENFRAASDIGIPLSTDSKYGLDTSGLDMSSPVVKSAAGQFASLTGELTGAEETLQSQLQSVYGGGDVRGSLDKLEMERKLALDELKGQRLGVARERLPQMERAQAQRAATGLAYSGPLERAIQYGETEQMGKMGQIAKEKRNLEKAYEGDVAAEKEKAREAQRQFSGAGGAVQNYWENIKDIFESARTGAEEVGMAGEDLLNAWSDFGQGKGLLGTDLGGMGVTGYTAFTEGQAGGYAPVTEFQQQPVRAAEFADQMVQQAIGKISGLSANPEIDPDYMP
tara:strand:- start:5105 stop:6517 length:1413 start_codon:yes stop_codon:yes gene_type:complete